MRDFGRGFARIHETLGEDSKKFMSLWDRIRDFERGFAKIRKDSRDFGRGFARIRKTLGEDSQGFARLWEEDLQGFMRIHETLERICKDLQGFTRLWERIHKDS